MRLGLTIRDKLGMGERDQDLALWHHDELTTSIDQTDFDPLAEPVSCSLHREAMRGLLDALSGSPPTAAERLPNVPTPVGTLAVSLNRTRISSRGMPSWSATIWRNGVMCP